MDWLEQLWIDLRYRVRCLFHRDRMREDLEDEMRFHLDMREGDRKRFGGITAIREMTQEMWRFGTLDTFMQDIRYGWRVALRTPGVSAIAVLSVALGIGANAGIFALVDRLVIRGIPVKDPQSLVIFSDQAFAWPRFDQFRQRTEAFESTAGVASLSGVRINDSDDPADTITGRLVSGNYFSTLGAGAMLGRTLNPDDDKTPGAHPLIVISYALWHARFHSDPDILNRKIRLGGAWLSSDWGSGGFEEDHPVIAGSREYSIIGVMPPGFFGETVGEQPDFWAPLMMEEQFLPGRHWISRKTANWVQVIARLKHGVTRQQAQAATNLLYRQLLTEEEGPAITDRRRREIAEHSPTLADGGRGFSQLRSQFDKPLWVLMAMVGVVLLIACANLANLLLARGDARRREIGTRLALGVSRSRLMRQLITESLLLSLAGAALSLPVGWAASRALFAMASAGRPGFSLDLAPDARILFFTGMLAVATVLIAGLIPAWRSTRVDLNSVLKESARAVTGGASVLTAGRIVVAVQVALSTALLFGTGLFVRTLLNLRSQDIGYSTDKVLMVRIDPTSAGYKGDDIGRVAQRILENVRRLPGVAAATYSDNGLFGGRDSGSRIRVEGFKPATARDSSASFDQVGPHYFASVGIPILLGRDFEDTDTAGAPRVTVINQTMAHFYFGSENPVGKTIHYDSRVKFDLTVIGVSKDVRDNSVRRVPPRRFYVSYMQPVDGQMGTDYAIRTPLSQAAMERQIRTAIHTVSPQMPVEHVKSLEASIDGFLLRERLIARLSILFGILALVLGCIGLYGVMAFAVVRRTQEIGIRMAIGAGARHIVGMVLRESALLSAAGVLTGIPLALGLTRYLESLLFGLKSMDIWSIALVVATMGVTALAASIVPALRAVRIDPLAALRCE